MEASEVTSDRVADAMTQFVKSMIGCDSEMDRTANCRNSLYHHRLKKDRNIFFGKGQLLQLPFRS